MADRKRIYLHIGAPKTGTTFLQRVLQKNREAMAEAGVLYPKLGREAHHTAVWSVRKSFDKTAAGAGIVDHWVRLVEESLDWTGDAVVISSELFCFSRSPRIAEILPAFRDAEVHVVYTARDLMRQVPAVWQEQIKNRQTMPYRDYLDDVLGRRKTALSRLFWGGQNARAVLKRWSRGLDPLHVHLVTTPPAGSPPDLLWERFAGVIGIDAGLYPADIGPANASLSITAAETLRRYNERFAEGLSIAEYRRIIRRQLDPAFATAVPGASTFPLTSAQRNKIVDISERMVGSLRRSGYDVVGSLDDLVPTRPDRGDHTTPMGPDDLSDSEIMVSLIDVLDYLLRRSGEVRGADRLAAADAPARASR